MRDETITYRPSKTLLDFHQDDSFVRGIKGPIGSGKSVGMVAEVMRRALEQEPNPADGIRYSRWVIIRNSYRELIDTTIKTFFDWVDEREGIFRKQDMTFSIKKMLPDGTGFQTEILFRALDKPSDVKKLLSLELTGAWLNEAKEIPKQVLDMVQGRVGRYPSKRMGGPTWFGVICDTNPPDSDHWWYRIFEEIRPETWSIFSQPSGLSPEAENIDNLPPNYYKNLMSGHDQEWINVYVHGKYGFVSDGNPVYLEYNDDVHYSHHPIPYVPGEPLYLGIDFGLTPACAFAQEINGQWRFIDEVTSRDMGALRFGKYLGQHIRKNYRNAEMIITGDPAGEQRAQTDERTPFEILSAVGIEADPAHTNDFVIRRETFASQFGRMTMTGEPGIIVGPNCKMLRRGLSGGYKYRRLQVVGEDKYVDKPDKNIYSHICEAGQYLLLGAGVDDQIITSIDAGDWDKVDVSHLNRAAS